MTKDVISFTVVVPAEARQAAERAISEGAAGESLLAALIEADPANTALAGLSAPTPEVSTSLVAATEDEDSRDSEVYEVTVISTDDVNWAAPAGNSGAAALLCALAAAVAI